MEKFQPITGNRGSLKLTRLPADLDSRACQSPAGSGGFLGLRGGARHPAKQPEKGKWLAALSGQLPSLVLQLLPLSKEPFPLQPKNNVKVPLSLYLISKAMWS